MSYSTRYYYAMGHKPPSKNNSTVEGYMLRETGDWRGYLKLADAGSIDTTPFLTGMVRYYVDTLDGFGQATSIEGGLLMALSVWGDKYLDKFLNYCLPSLLEAENCRALADAGAILFIHTNEHGKQVILQHGIIDEMIKRGFKVQMHMLNESVLDMIPGVANHKYWHLGMTQSLHLQYAKLLGVDYHLLMPDVAYSAGFFKRLIKLNRPIITHSGLPTATTIQSVLDKYKDGYGLNIPAAKMMTECFNHAHDRIKPYIVENKNYTRGHIIIWRGRDTVHIMSPHQTLAWVSRDLISAIPDRFFFTLDSEIEKIAPGVDVYQPCREDGLVMLEISEDIPASPRKEMATAEQYAMSFLAGIPEAGLRKIFLKGMQMPIENGDGLDDELIKEMQDGIRRCLSGS